MILFKIAFQKKFSCSLRSQGKRGKREKRAEGYEVLAVDTTRKPMRRLRNPASFQPRLAERQLLPLLSHEPPRRTR